MNYTADLNFLSSHDFSSVLDKARLHSSFWDLTKTPKDTVFRKKERKKESLFLLSDVNYIGLSSMEAQFSLVSMMADPKVLQCITKYLILHFIDRSQGRAVRLRETEICTTDWYGSR